MTDDELEEMLACPDEYETATGHWEACSVPDHCAGCGGTLAEHMRFVDGLRALLARKSAALGVVADPAMWMDRYSPYAFVWNGTGDLADPRVWAARERDATEGTRCG